MASKRCADVEGIARVKRSRKVLSLETKVQLLDRLGSGESVASVGHYFNVNESTVRTIRKSEAAIRASVACGTSKSVKVTYVPRDPNIEKMETALSIWMEDQSQKNVPLRSNIIRDKAKQIYDHLVETTGVGTVSKFRASKGWFENFKKRQSFHNVDVQVCRILELARSVGTERFDNLQAFDVEELLESHANELIKENLCDLVKSNDNDDEVKQLPELTLPILSNIMLVANNLTDMVVDVDPFLERSLKFKRDLEDLVMPYKEALIDLQKKEVQQSYFANYIEPTSSTEPSASGVGISPIHLEEGDSSSL